MKGLKNAAIFLAGGVTFMYLFAKGLENDSKNPRIGSIVYENDSMRVIRMGVKPPKNISLATIVYKDHSEEKDEESK